MTTLEMIQDLLIREHGLAREQVAPEAELGALGVDSLALVELIFQIEDRCAIRIRDDPPSDLHTVGDVARYVEGLLPGTA